MRLLSMFCHFLYKISAVILQNQNSWDWKGQFVPILLLPLHHFCSCGWTVLELGEGDPWKSASFPGHLSRNVSPNSYKQIHKQVKVCIYEVQGCDPAFCLTFFSQYPEFYYLTATAVKATSRLNIPQQFVHVCKYPDCLNCMLGNYHPHVPAAPHSAGALLCCPPYLELYSLPRVCRKALGTLGV